MAFYLSRTAASFDPIVVSWIGTAIAVSYAAYLTYSNAKGKGSSTGEKQAFNQDIKKDQPKVVDNFDVEDLGNKTVFCRCWRSKKFPLCDGSHGAYNKECGDNLGPLIIQKRNIQPDSGDK